VKDYVSLTKHFLSKREFKMALIHISKIEDSDIRNNLLIKQSSTLIRGAPEEFISALQDNARFGLVDKKQLIAALVQTPVTHLGHAYNFVRDF